MSFTHGWHVGNVVTARSIDGLTAPGPAAVPHQHGSPSASRHGAGLTVDDGYVVFVGWMLPAGGADRAICIARRAGKRIVLMARVWELAERQYFLDSIEPLLGADAVFVGDVAGERRLELLEAADALVTPARWPESLVRVFFEAVAAGTPIVALRDGIAADVIEDGKTGYLCGGDDEIARMLVHTVDIDHVRRGTHPAGAPSGAPPRVPWPCHAEPAHGIPLRLPPPGTRLGRGRWRRAAIGAP